MSAISIWIWPLISIAQNHGCRDVGKDCTLFSIPSLNPGSSSHVTSASCAAHSLALVGITCETEDSGEFYCPKLTQKPSKGWLKIVSKKRLQLFGCGMMRPGPCFLPELSLQGLNEEQWPHSFASRTYTKQWIPNTPSFCLCGEQRSKDEAKQQLWICLALFYPNQWTQKGKKPHTTNPQTHSLFPYRC